MKILSFLSVAAFMVMVFGCAGSSVKPLAENKNNGFAVVELFTSEGCSSCPPADKAIADLLNKHGGNIYVLAYHVDYWNNLGWKDVFSSTSYTQIQRDYAKAFKLSSVYTPQVVVNGSEQFVGSDKNKLNEAINKYLQEEPVVKFSIDARSANNKTVQVNYSTDATDAKIKIALVQLNATNKIQRGENSGATLHHVNIVRELQTVTPVNNGKVTLNIPEDLAGKDCHIIGFTQNVYDGKITAAGETIIQ